MSSCRTSAGSSSGVPGRGGEVGDRHRPAGHPRRRGDRRRCAVAGPVGAARHSDAGRRRGSAVGCARRLQRVTTRVVSAALVGHASDQAIGVGPGSTPAPDLTDRSWAPHPREGSGDSRVTPRPRDRRQPCQPAPRPATTNTFRRFRPPPDKLTRPGSAADRSCPDRDHPASRSQPASAASRRDRVSTAKLRSQLRGGTAGHLATSWSGTTVASCTAPTTRRGHWGPGHAPGPVPPLLSVAGGGTVGVLGVEAGEVCARNIQAELRSEFSPDAVGGVATVRRLARRRRSHRRVLPEPPGESGDPCAGSP